MPRNREPNINNSIRELRAAEDRMTQQSLADKVCVTRQTIVALEGGAYTPSLALALKIARLFEKNIEEIFWIDE